MTMVRTWLTNGDGETGLPYLIMFAQEGVTVGWQAADCSGVLGALSDQSYVSFIDETPDTLTVYRLTDTGPVPVRIKTERHEGMGIVGVDLVWRQPGVRGKAGRRSESGSIKIWGA